MNRYRAALIQGAWFISLLSTFLVCLSLSWLALAKLQYLYPAWYSLLSIEQHIDTYAPQNHFKQGYELTSAVEHKEHFALIAEAVHNQGQGLADIDYLYLGHRVPLLTHAEQVHLQDVANLIVGVKKLALILAAVPLLLLPWFWLKRIKPKVKTQMIWLFGLIASATISLLLIGAKRVFYQLHEWIFPQNHQWFFYYQESLMSTLMKAPDLFGAIGVAILLGGILLFVAVFGVLNKCIRQ